MTGYILLLKSGMKTHHTLHIKSLFDKNLTNSAKELSFTIRPDVFILGTIFSVTSSGSVYAPSPSSLSDSCSSLNREKRWNRSVHTSLDPSLTRRHSQHDMQSDVGIVVVTWTKITT